MKQITHTLLASVVALMLFSSAPALAGDMVKVTSKHSFDEIGKRLETVAKKYKYGVVGTHALSEALKKKKFDIGKRLTIYEVCSAGKAAEILKTDIIFATALPCRVAVWEEGGKTVIAMLTPSQLASLMKLSPAAQKVVDKATKEITAIINETAK